MAVLSLRFLRESAEGLFECPRVAEFQRFFVIENRVCVITSIIRDFLTIWSYLAYFDPQKFGLPQMIEVNVTGKSRQSSLGIYIINNYYER